MVDIDKQKLSQFIDQDGKIIISDDMPDDLKSAIKFMNDNNVGLFENIDVNFIDDEESEGVEETYDNISLSDASEDGGVSFEEEEDDLNEETDDSSLQDLDNLF